ncbi:MAG TPA: hypothetical protein VH373_09150 [Jatrophihabitantaceae bacterium]
MAERRPVPLPGYVEDVLDAALDKALRVQRPVIIAYLNRVRDRHRDATPAGVVRLLERRYLAAVTAVGAASGSAAAVPGAGTGISFASAAVEISAFVEATAVFALAIAEVHGIRIDDPEIRRALVLAILIGDIGVGAAELAVADAGSRWGQILSRRAPDETIKRINHILSRHLLTKFGTKQGALMLGRALPLGIGASIGAAGNLAFGRRAILAARRMFGGPPDRLPPRVIDAQIVEPVADPPGLNGKSPAGH